MAKPKLKKANQKSGAAADDAELITSVYSVLDPLQHDGDSYAIGDEIALDPASSTVAQLQELKVIGDAIARTVFESETPPPPPAS